MGFRRVLCRTSSKTLARKFTFVKFESGCPVEGSLYPKRTTRVKLIPIKFASVKFEPGFPEELIRRCSWLMQHIWEAQRR